MGQRIGQEYLTEEDEDAGRSQTTNQYEEDDCDEDDDVDEETYNLYRGEH